MADKVLGKDHTDSTSPLITWFTTLWDGSANKDVELTYIASLLASLTQTLTNKRIQKRQVTVTQSATPTINTDNGDIFNITGLAQAITSMTTNLSGTPVTNEMIMINITDDGTARAITRGASFVSTTAATMATTTIVNKQLTEIYRWNGSAWACMYSTSAV